MLTAPLSRRLALGIAGRRPSSLASAAPHYTPRTDEPRKHVRPGAPTPCEAAPRLAPSGRRRNVPPSVALPRRRLDRRHFAGGRSKAPTSHWDDSSGHLTSSREGTSERVQPMTEIATTPTCDARAGFAPTDYGFQPLWCDVRIGLRSYVDRGGAVRRFCSSRGHRDAVEGRYPPSRYVSEIDGDGLAEAKRAREIVIESNDGYEVTVDEDDEWTNREGMPEFNGSFR